MKILNQFITINFDKYRHFSKICYQAQWKVNILGDHKRGRRAGGRACRRAGVQAGGRSGMRAGGQAGRQVCRQWIVFVAWKFRSCYSRECLGTEYKKCLIFPGFFVKQVRKVLFSEVSLQWMKILISCIFKMYDVLYNLELHFQLLVISSGHIAA
jgi:hypothetical protein